MNKNTQTVNTYVKSDQVGPASESANGLFDFAGRIGRMEFFWTALIVVVTLMLIGGAIALFDKPGFGFWLLILLMLPVWYVGVAAGVKRCHDLGKSGWLYLLASIPIVGLIFTLYLLFAKGTGKRNQYGLQPNYAATTSSSFPLSSNATIETPTNFINAGSDVTPKIKSSEQIDQTELPFAENVDENAAYAQIAHELEAKSMDKGLWLKAMVQSGGDSEIQQAIAYTGLRLKQLRLAAITSQVKKLPITQKTKELVSLTSIFPEDLKSVLQYFSGNLPELPQINSGG